MDALLTVQHTSHFFFCVFQLIDPSVSSDFSLDTVDPSVSSPANEMSPSLLVSTPDFQLDVAHPIHPRNFLASTRPIEYRMYRITFLLIFHWSRHPRPRNFMASINFFSSFFLGFLACCFSFLIALSAFVLFPPLKTLSFLSGSLGISLSCLKCSFQAHLITTA